MRWNREHISTGMTVRSSDGQKLGKVIALGADNFEIEKGFFILKDYLVRYSDILDVRDGECFLRYGKADLRPIEEDAQDARTGELGTGIAGAGAYATGRQEPAPMETMNANARAETLATMRGRDLEAREALDAPIVAETETVEVDALAMDETATPAPAFELDDAAATTIPLARERLTISKRDTQRGEVHIHKTVETQTETVEVPLRRERVSVEHVRAGATTGIEIGDAAFEERDYTIPLHAEEVEVTKETVIDEELRVTKVPYEETQRISKTLRHEHAEVRADSDVDVEERGKLGWKADEKEPTRY